MLDKSGSNYQRSEWSDTAEQDVPKLGMVRSTPQQP